MSLAAPLFLLGLFALIVPWVLHRLNQHDAPVQAFPSDQFLQPTTAVSSRKKQLRYLKLLAIRLLLVGLVCLLFAQPAIKRLAGVFGDTDKLHIIVLDKSFSMQRVGSWIAAKDRVEEIVDALPVGSNMQLISAGAALTEETSVTVDNAVIMAAMVSIQPGNERLNYGELMRQLSTLAAETELAVVVHVVSDMQASAVPARASDLRTSGFHALELYNVRANENSPNASNSAVRSYVKVRDQGSFDVKAEITRFGAVNEQTLSLYKEGEIVATTTVPAGADDIFLHSFESINWPASQTLDQYELKLTPPDSLPADDSDTISVRREPELPIAIVSNASGRQRRASVDELYLKTALSLDPRNRVTTYSAEALNVDADTKVLIYLDHLAVDGTTVPALPERLARLSEEGVHILYVLNAATPRLDDPLEIVSAESSHPLGLNLGAWEDVRFYALQSYQSETNQSVLLGAGLDYPVLIEQLRENNAQSRGKLFWLNAALNGADNSLPVSPVFVPFLTATIDYFVRTDAYPTQLTVGDGIALEKSVQLLDPDGNAMVDLADRGKGKTQLLTELGVYTLLEAEASFPIKVVTDMAESDLRQAGSDDLQRWQYSTTNEDASNTIPDSKISNNDPSTAEVDSSNSLISTPATGKDNALLSLTRWLLPASLFLLLLETLYANWHLRARRT